MGGIEPFVEYLPRAPASSTCLSVGREGGHALTVDLFGRPHVSTTESFDS